MKVFNKARITTGLLVMGIMASFTGAITSSLAWYAYSTTSTLSYKGTSVAQSEQLQIGLMITITPDDPNESPFNVTFTQEQEEEYGITYKTVDNKTYAFCEPGTGLKADLISRYLSVAGHATNELTATTSKKYEEDDDLELYQHLWCGTAVNNHKAEKETYSKLPLAFRINQFDSSTGTYYFAKDQSIWMSEATAIADGAGEVYKAVRTHIKSDLVNFTLNPSAAEAGYTTVGGLLDLNDDGYYDTTGGLIDYETEIVYGSYDGDLPTPVLNPTESDLIDVNNTGNATQATTFTAKHADNRFIYSDLSSVQFHKAYYKSINDIKPSQNSYGVLSGGKVLCKTSDDDNGIAELDLTIWLEGWDHSVVNSEIDHKFALGLTFEINRVR